MRFTIVLALLFIRCVRRVYFLGSLLVHIINRQFITMHHRLLYRLLAHSARRLRHRVLVRLVVKSVVVLVIMVVVTRMLDVVVREIVCFAVAWDCHHPVEVHVFLTVRLLAGVLDVQSVLDLMVLADLILLRKLVFAKDADFL